jgi:hypothetical protein
VHEDRARLWERRSREQAGGVGGLDQTRLIKERPVATQDREHLGVGRRSGRRTVDHRQRLLRDVLRDIRQEGSEACRLRRACDDPQPPRPDGLAHQLHPLRVFHRAPAVAVQGPQHVDPPAELLHLHAERVGERELSHRPLDIRRSRQE